MISAPGKAFSVRLISLCSSSSKVLTASMIEPCGL